MHNREYGVVLKENYKEAIPGKNLPGMLKLARKPFVEKTAPQLRIYTQAYVDKHGTFNSYTKPHLMPTICKVFKMLKIPFANFSPY